MAHVRPRYDLGSPDRLGLTLFLAAALHAIVILGLGFAPPDLVRKDKAPLMLDVILVNSATDKPPEKADALAQVDQRGSGEVTEPVRPAGPMPSPLPIPGQGEEPELQIPGAPPAPPAPPRTVLSTETPRPHKAPAPAPKPTPLPQELPSAAELIARSHEFANHIAEIRRHPESNAQDQRHEYITAANTKAYDYAMYENAWRDKVERIGNLNYPDEAKRKGISGSLVLDVAINADGSLYGITLKRSSGHKILDDGAERIVRMAAPFASFSEQMRRKVDVLHIVRKWQFYSEGALETGGT